MNPGNVRPDVHHVSIFKYNRVLLQFKLWEQLSRRELLFKFWATLHCSYLWSISLLLLNQRTFVYLVCRKFELLCSESSVNKGERQRGTVKCIRKWRACLCGGRWFICMWVCGDDRIALGVISQACFFFTWSLSNCLEWLVIESHYFAYKHTPQSLPF